MKDRLRVALVSEVSPTVASGLKTRLRSVASGLVQGGDEVLIVAPRDRHLPHELGDAPVIGARSVKNLLYPNMNLGLPVWGSKTVHEIEKFNPDIVHVLNPFVFGLNGIRYAHRRELPLVASYQTHLPTYTREYKLGMLEKPLWRYMKAVHDRADVTFTSSSDTLHELQDRGFQRIELWSPGVDSKLFHPDKRSQQRREELTNGHPEKTILLSVGRMEPEKNLDTLIPVIHHLADQDCHLVFVGSGKVEDKLKEQAKGLPVTFTGTLTGEELATTYASSDLFLMPSTTEVLGLVTLEAMASGLPVIGSNSKGTRFLLDDNEQGLLVTPADPNAFIQAISVLRSDNELQRRFSHNARDKAERLSWNSLAEELHTRYEELISQTGQSAKEHRIF